MDLASSFAELTEGLSKGGSLLLFTDYDGSLSPIVTDPAAARLSSEARRDLRALSRLSHVRIAVISGRALADVRSRVNISGLVYAGCHGFEVAGRGLHFRHPEAEAQRGRLEVVARTLAPLTGVIPGMIVEAKGLAVAVHYRQVAPENVAQIALEVEHVVQEAAEGEVRAPLRILRGNKALEIVPGADWSKGKCALWIWSRLALNLPRPAMMLYMGDDSTDEQVFRSLAGQAVTVRVGPVGEPTAAGYRIPQGSQVLRLLSALAEELAR